MTTKLANSAIQRLLQAQLAQEQSGKASIVAPDAVGYGAFGQNYAGALAQGAQDPFYGGADIAALQQGAEHESQDYDRRLAAANAAALASQESAQKYGVWKTIADNTPEAQWRNGMFGGADGSTMAGADPVLGMAANALTNSGQQADIHKNEAAATKDLYASGVQPDIADVNNTQGNAIFGTPAQYGAFKGGVNPGDQASITSADAAAANAQTNAQNANTNAREVDLKAAGGQYVNDKAPGTGDPYNTVLGNGAYGSPSGPLTSMTLGQVYDFGRSTLIPNSKRAGVGKDQRGLLGSSASGAYQITGETLANVAPQVLGPDWRNTPFTPQVQDQLGEAIYNNAVQNGTPLNKVWASLSPKQAAALKGQPWEAVRGAIIQGETGASDPAGYGAFKTKGNFKYTPDPANPGNTLTFDNLGAYNAYMKSIGKGTGSTATIDNMSSPRKGSIADSLRSRGAQFTKTPTGDYLVVGKNGQRAIVSPAGILKSGSIEGM